jgi:hypothetical protein
MSQYVPVALRRLVQERARFRCEYCLLHEDDVWLPHGTEHIIATKHRGKTREDNLAWACYWCNAFKGSDLASIDAETGRVVRLFNPRSDKWQVHFRAQGSYIVPLSARGRVTEFLLRFNLPRLVEQRMDLVREGRYPG